MEEKIKELRAAIEKASAPTKPGFLTSGRNT